MWQVCRRNLRLACLSEENPTDRTTGHRACSRAISGDRQAPAGIDSAQAEVKSMATKITPSSGNVFADLGFGDNEAEHLRIRSTLMGAVRKLIEDRNFTQAEAARLFGVTQ